MPTARPTSDLASWGLIAAMVAAFFLRQGSDRFTFDRHQAPLPAAGLILLTVAMLVGRRAARPRLAAAATAFLQMTLFTMAGVALAYAMAAHAGPLWDARFAAADRALGLDWPAIRALVDRSAFAVLLLAIAYHSLIVQMIIVIVALSEARRFDELRVAVCAAIVGGFATVLWSGVMPAMGNLFDASHYRHLWPSIASQHAAIVEGLRSGALRTLDPSRMLGIVTFPSFHATLAAIFLWAYRPLPRLARPGMVWAGLTIVATPIGGGHYGTDVIAGLLLAPLSIALAKRLVTRSPAARRSVPAPAAPVLGSVIAFPQTRLRRSATDLWRVAEPSRRAGK